MKTARIGIVLVVCMLLSLATCVTTPKYEEQLKELTRYGYFTLREQNKNGNYGPVFIFTERHDSRLIQAEIAWGLEVLRETRGVNMVALEGMFIGEVMDAEKLAYETDIDKYIVTLALLEHGEIKAPELMYLAMDSFVFGMENEDEYNVIYPAGANDALLNYLIRSIGGYYGMETLDAVLAELPIRLDDDDIDRLSSQYPLFNDTYNILSYSRSGIEVINRMAEIEEKASQFTFGLPSQIRRDFRQLKEFYEVTYQRSLTMAGHILDTLKIKDEPLSMIIGDGHAEDVVEFFEKNNVSYYVLEPRGSYETDIWSDLTDAEYIRRVQGLPFFSNSQIESFFVNELNPRPVVAKDWFRKVNNFASLARNMIKLAKSGQIPESQFNPVFFSSDLNVSRASLDVSNPSDIKFFIENGSERGGRLYVRAVQNPERNQFGSFKKALEEIIEKLFKIDEQNPPFSERIKAYEGLVEVFNLDDYAVYISPSSEVWDNDFIKTR
jgi:hypothetical protein